MPTRIRTRGVRGGSLVGALILACALGVPLRQATAQMPAEPSALSIAAAGFPSMKFALLDSLFGRSGKLKARFISRARAVFGIEPLERLFGDSSIHDLAAITVGDSLTSRQITFLSLLPFSAKRGGHVGGYLVGYWPSEHRAARSDAYENPEGFIEVTPENADMQVSDHFRLRDFLTHDQEDVWPKYLVLNERLIDKLELVIEDLQAHGVHVDHMVVMSGFRTPEYNRQGVHSGRARESRHQYGDAADVYIDNNGDGRMSDLNHDGRVDSRDARVIREAVDRVEAAHPELVGGVGVYRGTRSHGPFVHIDARGTRARWGRV